MNAEQHVLIVDNDARFNRTADIILRKEGYRTSIAWNGMAALNIIRGGRCNCHPVDILLTDLRMPVMNGFDLIVCVRREGIDIPAIAATGYGDVQTLAQLIRCGVSGYLAKPCTAKELLDAVRSAGRKITRGQSVTSDQ